MKIMMCVKSQKTNIIFQLAQEIGWFLVEKREENDLDAPYLL